MWLKVLTLICVSLLISCGFTVELPELEVSSSSVEIDTLTVSGTEVGEANLKNECIKKSYSIKDSFNGYFAVNQSGKVILSKDSPPIGVYDVPVEIRCDKRSKTAVVKVEIKPFIIPVTPFAGQLGSSSVSTLVPGDVSNRDECSGNGFFVDELGNTYCTGATRSSISDINAGGSDALIIKRDYQGNVVWVFQLGTSNLATLGGDGSTDEYCHNINVDEIGNIYCYGTTKGSLLEPYGGGTNDIFIMKISSNGSLVWLKHIGATTSALFGGDASGADYCSMSAYHNGSFYCAGDTESSLGEAVSGNKDFLFIKTLSDGTISWIKQIGATTSAALGGTATAQERCDDFKVDNSGNIYCVGLTHSSISETKGGGNDVVAMKIDINGNIVWFTQIGMTTAAANSFDASSFETCDSMAFSSDGNIVCGGLTTGSLVEAGGGSGDILFLKFNSTTGAVIWGKQMGSITLTGFGGDPSGNDYCKFIALDSSDNIYCSGVTTGSLNEMVGGNDDVFISKHNSTGDPIWIRHFGQTTSGVYGGNAANKESCRSFHFDNNGNSYMAGATWSNFGEASGSLGLEDLYVTKVDNNGNILWLRQLGASSAASMGANSSGREECFNVLLDHSQNVYCQGNTLGSLFEASGGNLDTFLWKLSPNGDFL